MEFSTKEPGFMNLCVTINDMVVTQTKAIGHSARETKTEVRFLNKIFITHNLGPLYFCIFRTFIILSLVFRTYFFVFDNRSC